MSEQTRKYSAADTTPRYELLKIDGASVYNDFYSNRFRCDHPQPEDPSQFAQSLRSSAQAALRSRVMVLTNTRVATAMVAAGYQEDAIIPSFYGPGEDCHVLGTTLLSARKHSANPTAAEKVSLLIDSCPAPKKHLPVETRLATVEDAPSIAKLMNQTFYYYPTPSGSPGYIAAQIQRGVPFRLVEEEGELVSSASAEIDRTYLSAELTDCATKKEARGKGYMQAILKALVGDLRVLGYRTAYTFARATEAGVNLSFQRLECTFQGCIYQSCRIGSGLEDMNVWAMQLD